MHAETVREELLDLVVPRLVNFSLDTLLISALEKAHMLRLRLQYLDDLHGSVVSGGSLVHKDDDLLAHLQDAKKVIEDDLVHNIVSTLRISHLFHAVESALKWRGSVASVEAESPKRVRIDEFCHVQVVGKRGRKTYESDRLLVLETSGQGARDQALQDQTSLIVQQMDFIDDHAIDK